MTEPTDKDINDARAAAEGAKLYRTIVAAGDAEVTLLFKKPSKAEFHRFLDAVGAKDAKAAAITRAQETFVLSCRLWPEAAELKQLFAEFYTLGTHLSEEIVKVAAGDAKATTEGL